MKMKEIIAEITSLLTPVFILTRGLVPGVVDKTDYFMLPSGLPISFSVSEDQNTVVCWFPPYGKSVPVFLIFKKTDGGYVFLEHQEVEFAQSYQSVHRRNNPTVRMTTTGNTILMLPGFGDVEATTPDQHKDSGLTTIGVMAYKVVVHQALEFYAQRYVSCPTTSLGSGRFEYASAAISDDGLVSAISFGGPGGGKVVVTDYSIPEGKQTFLEGTHGLDGNNFGAQMGFSKDGNLLFITSPTLLVSREEAGVASVYHREEEGGGYKHLFSQVVPRQEGKYQVFGGVPFKILQTEEGTIAHFQGGYSLTVYKDKQCLFNGLWL